MVMFVGVSGLLPVIAHKLKINRYISFRFEMRGCKNLNL